jgi:hypothetical protein
MDVCPICWTLLSLGQGPWTAGSASSRATCAASGTSAATPSASWRAAPPWPSRRCPASRRGRPTPTLVTLCEIAAALAVPVAHLLTEYGSPVLVRRAPDTQWSQTPDGAVRELDQIYGFGYVRTSLIRHARTEDVPLLHRGHRPGTLHHAYVMSGDLSIGPVGEQVSVSRGDFVRFPGDVPHQTLVLSETAVLHMVTTIPHVAQIEPRP